VITGSYNFTNSSERDNDENLVIVDDPALARAYIEEFERVYAQAQSPARCR
jgi:phosphatidylserine/phosphatidylglycerophosphate/cardiolipin synthase-like enzyme